jgi:hypothetical protein
MDLLSTPSLPQSLDSAAATARSFADARRHAIYQIAHTITRAYPFPHVMVEDAFPQSFYSRIQAALPSDEAYSVTGLDSSGRPDRFALSARQVRGERLDAPQRAFWSDAFDAFDHPDTGAWMIAKFYEVLAERLSLADPATGRELRGTATLVRERGLRAESPHVMDPSSVVTAFFQLPRNANRREAGLSLYAPKDPALRCNGGRAHDRDAFDLVTTLPYKPNTLVVVPKTDASFVGFEALEDDGATRDILRFDLTLPAKLVH